MLCPTCHAAVNPSDAECALCGEELTAGFAERPTAPTRARPRTALAEAEPPEPAPYADPNPYADPIPYAVPAPYAEPVSPSGPLRYDSPSLYDPPLPLDGRRERQATIDWGEPDRRTRLPLLVAATVVAVGLIAVAYIARPGAKGNITVAVGATSPAQVASHQPEPAVSNTGISDSAGPSAEPVDPSQSSNVADDALVSADSTAPGSVDAAQHATSYRPGNVTDADPSTAWRTPGDGIGQSLTFTFTDPVTLTSVGMTNGYTKRDPTSRTDRYRQERRILSVTWSFDDNRQFTQNLVDSDWNIQSIDVPSVTTTSVRLTINSTTAPGDASYDFTAVSEVDLEGQ